MSPAGGPSLGSRILATFTLLVIVLCCLDADESGGVLSTGVIVGIVVAAVVLAVIVIASIVLICFKTRRTTDAPGVNQISSVFDVPRARAVE